MNLFSESNLDRIVHEIVPSNERVECVFPCLVYEFNDPFLTRLFFGPLAFLVTEIETYMFVMTDSYVYFVPIPFPTQEQEIHKIPVQEVKVKRGMTGIVYQTIYFESRNNEWKEKVKFSRLRRYPEGGLSKDWKHISEVIQMRFS